MKSSAACLLTPTAAAFSLAFQQAYRLTGDGSFEDDDFCSIHFKACSTASCSGVGEGGMTGGSWTQVSKHKDLHASHNGWVYESDKDMNNGAFSENDENSFSSHKDQQVFSMPANKNYVTMKLYCNIGTAATKWSRFEEFKVTKLVIESLDCAIPTAAPTTAPTKVPTKVPTLYPTPHPCDDGSHGCESVVEGGICYRSTSNVWTCSCASDYWCVSGCNALFSAHECAPVTSTPTKVPTKVPTHVPTPVPTL
jgi:hypothetical protein